jgi:hypothetical protein
VSTLSPDELNPYENLDRLLNVEMRIKKAPMGIVPQLYRLARLVCA